jgi:hypothetical protein
VPHPATPACRNSQSQVAPPSEAAFRPTTPTPEDPRGVCGLGTTASQGVFS